MNFQNLQNQLHLKIDLLNNRMNNLFNSKKELLLFFIVAFTIFGLNLSYEFYKFKDFKTQKFRYVDAVVEQSYLKTKNDKTYRVLKLKNGDFSFYTTTKKENELKNQIWHKTNAYNYR